MKRTLELELMDTLSEAEAYDEMDHSEANRAFVDDLCLQITASDTTGEVVEVLDLGTGTALIPIELCEKKPGVRVMAVDGAASMLDVAIRNIDIAGLRDRILLQQADAKGLTYDDGRFAVVMSNSLVHHIPAPLAVLREAVRVTRPGGLLFFRDLLRPSDEQGVQELVSRHAGGADDRQREMLADSLRAALTLEEIRGLVAELGFPSQSVQPTSDRHWTWSARRRT